MTEDEHLADVIPIRGIGKCSSRGRHMTHPATWGKSGWTTCTTCGCRIHVEVTEDGDVTQ